MINREDLKETTRAPHPDPDLLGDRVGALEGGKATRLLMEKKPLRWRELLKASHCSPGGREKLEDKV